MTKADSVRPLAIAWQPFADQLNRLYFDDPARFGQVQKDFRARYVRPGAAANGRRVPYVFGGFGAGMQRPTDPNETAGGYRWGDSVAAGHWSTTDATPMDVAGTIIIRQGSLAQLERLICGNMYAELSEVSLVPRRMYFKVTQGGTAGKATFNATYSSLDEESPISVEISCP